MIHSEDPLSVQQRWQLTNCWRNWSGDGNDDCDLQQWHRHWWYDMGDEDDWVWCLSIMSTLLHFDYWKIVNENWWLMALFIEDSHTPNAKTPLTLLRQQVNNLSLLINYNSLVGLDPLKLDQQKSQLRLSTLVCHRCQENPAPHVGSMASQLSTASAVSWDGVGVEAAVALGNKSTLTKGVLFCSS